MPPPLPPSIVLAPPTRADIQAAAARLHGRVLRTPLVRLAVPGLSNDIYVKLENLQPGGSFKLRPALNALMTASDADLAQGVYTASAGNMAQGLARGAKALGVSVRVYAPQTTGRAKIGALERLGADVVLLPFDDWWRILANRGKPGERGLFIHPAADPAVLAGDGTIGLEILEDLPDVDTIIVPYGGGGLSCGIAAAIKGSGSPARVLACETNAGTPVAAAMAAQWPVPVEFQSDAFLMGVGGAQVLPEMWPLVSTLIDGTVCVERSAVARAVEIGFEATRTVMEGAGAAPLAAALASASNGEKVVAVVSGGNIDRQNFIAVLEGRVP